MCVQLFIPYKYSLKMNGDPDRQKIFTKGDVVMFLTIEKLGHAMSRFI